MEDDEDDFYGGGGANEEQQVKAEAGAEDKDEQMDVSEEGEDDDDSDDDVQFTLEKPEGAKAEPAPSTRTTRQQAKAAATAAKEEPVKSGTPIKTDNNRAGSAAPAPTAIKGALTHNSKEGKDFPEVRTSKVDVNAIPTWPANGKPVTELDIDADLAENSKPWRLPGTDQTDFFNYGFDEYTWTQYCIRQQSMSNTISQQRQEDAQMKAFFGGPGGGGGGGQNVGMPPMPPGMPPGMPTDPDSMAQMANAMGVPLEALQHMMGGAGGQGMGMNMGMGGGQQQFGQQGGGYGSGQNSISPAPQGGQGFQPPSGPSGGGQQGGFLPNIDGYSPQQLAIMQQEQQGHGGGGGGGGGRGRGRRGRW